MERYVYHATNETELRRYGNVAVCSKLYANQISHCLKYGYSIYLYLSIVLIL